MPALARVWPALCKPVRADDAGVERTRDLDPGARSCGGVDRIQTFRSFEVYILVTLVYLALALALRGLLAVLEGIARAAGAARRSAS